MAEEHVTVPRGRHAPPLEVRLNVQRQRLFEAAAKVFSTVGYADASAEAISREAGMSKATGASRARRLFMRPDSLGNPQPARLGSTGWERTR